MKKVFVFTIAMLFFNAFLIAQTTRTSTMPSEQATTQKTNSQNATSQRTTDNTKEVKGEGDKGDIYRLQIGEKLPMGEVKMMDISGEELSLDDIMGENGLILNFSCNTCPFVVAYEDRYPEIEELAKNNGMGLALINSNEKKRRGDNMDDSLEAMQEHAKEMKYNSYYLVDKNHQLADAIGAFTTPHVFLFNADKELVYKGAIDDNWREKGGVTEKYLENAVKASVAGEKANPAETKGKGCSIKRIK